MSRGRPQFLYLVLEGQLAPLEPGYFEGIARRVRQSLVDFAFDIAMLPLQLCKMGCKRHDRFSLHRSSIAPSRTSTAGRFVTAP